MKLLIHDLSEEYTELFKDRFDKIIQADGKYAFCLGCYKCWTQDPGRCFMNDSLKDFGSIIGKADELMIISRNVYGAFSPEIKGVLERGIGASTSTTIIKAKETHHESRYGEHHLMKIYAYGDFAGKERETFEFVAKRTAKNYNYEDVVFETVDDPAKLKEAVL